MTFYVFKLKEKTSNRKLLFIIFAVAKTLQVWMEMKKPEYKRRR